MAVKRSNEGGRPVSLASEGLAAGGDIGGTPAHPGTAHGRAYKLSEEPMRVEPGEETYPGAANDESNMNHVEMMAENIARMHPSHEQRKRAIAAKLRAAVEAMS